DMPNLLVCENLYLVPVRAGFGDLQQPSALLHQRLRAKGTTSGLWNAGATGRLLRMWDQALADLSAFAGPRSRADWLHQR
ncbi:MAG TPA: hypothetical protein VFO20_04800, partial [Propionibacteriaceae bacterium]|nr:hypothetical protein [Propionibacteriaceae bacterium]